MLVKLVPKYLIPLFTLLIVVGCKKDSVLDSSTVKDQWQAVSPAEYESDLRWRDGEIHVNQNGQIFVIEEGSGGFNPQTCWCSTNGEADWLTFTVDSGSTNFDGTFIVREDNAGNIWVLRDSRIVKITGCGSSESYTYIKQDTTLLSDFENRFIDMEIINGVPWLLNGKWGVYHYDSNLDSLVNHPITSFHPGDDLEDITGYNSIGIGPDGGLLVVTNQGKFWRVNSEQELFPDVLFLCETCLFRDLTGGPHGDTKAFVSYPTGESEWVSLFDLSPMATLSRNVSPYYFTRFILDANSQFAYYSKSPIPESYIGIGQGGSDPLVINLRDAAEEGNVQAYHIGFSDQNQLYALTDKGVIKYLGRDE